MKVLHRRKESGETIKVPTGKTATMLIGADGSHSRHVAVYRGHKDEGIACLRGHTGPFQRPSE